MFLRDITELDYVDILRLTSKKSVMKFVGNGEIWDSNKVKRFIHYNVLETNISDSKRNNFYYKIVISNRKQNQFTGIIGFHKFPILKNNNFFLTIYLDPKFQGQGLFSNSLQLLIRKMKKHLPNIKKLYSLVHSNNTIMNSISEKKFTLDSKIKLSKIILNQYVIFLDVPFYRKKFYLVVSDYLSKTMVTSVFANLNKYANKENVYWEEYKITKPQVSQPSFLLVDGKNTSLRNLRKLKPEIKNILGDEKKLITQKDQLYLTLQKNKKLHKFRLEQFNLNIKDAGLTKYKNIFSQNTWILKPVDGFAGKGITIIDSYPKLLQEIDKNKSKKNKYVRWVLQEYITNPLLYKKKKFHIRAYFIYSNSTSNKKGYLLNIAKVFTAKDNFYPGDYDNSNIHDTHLKTTPKPIYFNRDFNKEYGKANTMKIWKQIIKMFKELVQMLDIDCYAESKKCFEILGADLMVTEDYQVKVIEINTKIGLGSYKQDPIDVHRIIFENVMDIVLERFKLDGYVRL